MLSTSARCFGLTFLLSCTLLCAPLQAKTLTYRSEAEVQLTHPEDYALGLFLAQQAAEQRAFSQAEPDYIVGYLMKISVLIGQFKANDDSHKLDEALRTSTELIDKYPQDPYLHMVRAALYLYQDVIPAQGIQDIEKAIALHPAPAPAIYDLLMGMITKKSKLVSQSQQAFQRACEKGIPEACQPNKLPKIDMN